MKCEVCLELLEEFLDGELAPAEHAHVEAHLIACADCAASHAALTAEQELFARYDRAVDVPPFLWTRVAAHTVSEPKRSWFAKPIATALALLLIAILIGLAYFTAKQNRHVPEPFQASGSSPIQSPNPVRQPVSSVAAKRNVIAVRAKLRPRVAKTIDQSDVLSSDLTGFDMEELDTARHIEQSENLLRSIRNVPITDSDEEIDVTYDKALSRRLLNENVVLRRDAEMKAKFPTKTLLADLEPFLLDIANLPDRARPEDVRVIKERVQKTEIVAALLDYQDRSPNDR